MKSRLLKKLRNATVLSEVRRWFSKIKKICSLFYGDLKASTVLRGINLTLERVSHNTEGAWGLFTLCRVLRRGQMEGGKIHPFRCRQINNSRQPGNNLRHAFLTKTEEPRLLEIPRDHPTSNRLSYECRYKKVRIV